MVKRKTRGCRCMYSYDYPETPIQFLFWIVYSKVLNNKISHHKNKGTIHIGVSRYIDSKRGSTGLVSCVSELGMKL